MNALLLLYFLEDKADKCLRGCTFEYEPVCGSDGQTYDNLCLFKIGKCRNNQLKKVSDGQCGGKFSNMNFQVFFTSLFDDIIILIMSVLCLYDCFFKMIVKNAGVFFRQSFVLRNFFILSSTVTHPGKTSMHCRRCRRRYDVGLTSDAKRDVTLHIIVPAFLRQSL